MNAPTAIIAEDEPLLRGELREMLAAQWPELDVRAEVGDGPAAARAVAEHTPDSVPRHRDAGDHRPRSRAAGQRQVPRRVRHGVRQIRGCRLRARRGRLRHEAVLRSAARRHDRALEGAACRPACRSHGYPEDAGDESRATQGLPALDHRRARRFAASHHRRRDLLLPRRSQVHAGCNARLGGAHPPAAQSARRGGRSRKPSGRSTARRWST